MPIKPRGIDSRRCRPVDDCFMKKVSSPFPSGRKIPVGAAAEFVPNPVTANQTTCSKSGDEAFGRVARTPAFPAIHALKMREGVGQILSNPAGVFWSTGRIGI